MSSWQEIERLRKNPDEFRGMAARLSQIDGLTEWEGTFLEAVARDVDRKEYSTRQAEKLVEIRNSNQLLTEVKGFSVRRLLQQCYEARTDLSEEDEAWLLKIWTPERAALPRGQAFNLLRLARELGAVDAESEAELA